MNTAEQRRRQRRRSIIQQLQERNQGIEDTLERLQIELNLNRQIIDELLTDDGDIEDYSTSVEGIEEILSVEIIPSPGDRKPRAQALAATPTQTQKRKTKKEEQKASLDRARAWALDRSRDKERKRK
jgi:hypothetical protein